MRKIIYLFSAVLLFATGFSTAVQGAVTKVDSCQLTVVSLNPGQLVNPIPSSHPIALPQLNPVEKLVTVYTSQIGVRELTGHNDGKMVEAYLASAGRHKGDAWCASFCYWCHSQAGIKAPRTGWSPGWFPTNHTVWTRGVSKDFNVRQGDVFGIYFSSLKRIAHVGFIDKPDPKVCITVEGNTNEAGSREGDGVYRKRRLTRQLYKIAQYT